MKFSFLLLVQALLFGYEAYAQDIEIYKEGYTTDISGTTVFGAGDTSEMKYYMNVKNNTSDTLDLKITRLRIEEVSGALDLFCFGETFISGGCYDGIGMWSSSEVFSFRPGVSGILYSYHYPKQNFGVAKYRYYVMSNDVALDSVDVQYNAYLSVKPEKPTRITVYPNPADDLLNVTLENFGGTGSISIYDITGKVVSSSNLKNGKNQLNIETLKAGVYFYAIRNDKDIIETKKLLIQ